MRRGPLAALACLAPPALALLLWLLPPNAAAHGMHLQARPASTHDGWVIQGQLSYSDESPAEGNYIRVESLDQPDFPALALQTDPGGAFQLPALAGHRYRITAQGEEGHTTATEVLVAPREAPASEDEGWPIYLVIAAFLLASLVPAYLLRKR